MILFERQKMRIAKCEEIITPPVGTTIAGYAPYDETYRKVGELVVSMLALDDGKNRHITPCKD